MESKRPPITTIIICQDNESFIRNCLDSVTWTDEIIAVDSGSSDKTVEILTEAGAKTYHKEWGGFRKQKEHAMSLATNDWILEVDTDEFLSAELIDEISNITPEQWSAYTCFEVPRLTYFQDKPIYHCGWFPDHKPRLYNRKNGTWVGLNIHEHFSSFGAKKKLESILVHKPPWDISSFMKRTLNYAIMNAKDYADTGRKARFIDLTLRPLYTFFYKFFVRRGFLDGMRGFIICCAESFGVFVKYAVLMDIQRKK